MAAGFWIFFWTFGGASGFSAAPLHPLRHRSDAVRGRGIFALVAFRKGDDDEKGSSLEII